MYSLYRCKIFNRNTFQTKLEEPDTIWTTYLPGIDNHNGIYWQRIPSWWQDEVDLQHQKYTHLFCNVCWSKIMMGNRYFMKVKVNEEWQFCENQTAVRLLSATVLFQMDVELTFIQYWYTCSNKTIWSKCKSWSRIIIITSRVSSRGNRIGSVFLYVCLWTLSWLVHLTYDLDFWYGTWPWR